MDSGERLNKFLAVRLGIGRREADNLVAKGRVLVNGISPAMGARVHSSDKVKVNGKPIDTKSPGLTYLLMNKPVGYVCSKRQQGDTPTIYNLLPPKYKSLKTVGRLDKDSSGLILLTNDGSFAHQLTHPSFTKVKKYEVTLDKPLSPDDLTTLNKGIELADGISRLKVQPLKNSAQYTVTMHEGRNRQIRRTFAAIGYKVIQLHRTMFGAHILGTLHPGESIEVVGRP